jgi:hypothetical protein
MSLRHRKAPGLPLGVQAARLKLPKIRLFWHYGIVDPERTVNEPFFSGLRTHNAYINWMSTTRLAPRFTPLPYVVF